MESMFLQIWELPLHCRVFLIVYSMDTPARLYLLRVPIDQSTLNRVVECESYIPYSQRPLSCTENASAVLGFMTEQTFQEIAQIQAARPHPADIPGTETSLTRAANKYSSNT